MTDPPPAGDQTTGTDSDQRAADPYLRGANWSEPPPWARTTARAPWATDPRAQWSRPHDYQSAWPPRPAYAPEPGSSPLAVIAATVLLVLGALVTMVSLIMLAVGAAGDELLELAALEAGMPGGGDGMATIMVVIGAFMVVIGVLHMVAAIGVFIHKPWARWLGVALAAMGLALGALMALGGLSEPAADMGTWLIVLIWLTAYVAALAGLAAGGEQFQAARSRQQ